MKNKAFTIVELIVVITILAILSTIWFISYSWYLIWIRDTNRISQLESVEKGLNTAITHGKLPFPDSYVEIKSWSNTIWYQWDLWKNVLETIEYSWDWYDPLDNVYFTYYLTKNRKYFQLMAFLEDKNNLRLAWVFDKSYASVDYSNRYPTFVWKKLWMLLNEDNTPINSTWSLTTFDISDVWTTKNYKSYLTDNQFVYWSWTIFSPLVQVDKFAWKYYSVVNNNFIYNNPN